MQPVVADSQSFRRLLEFWTIVAENDDKIKKIVYQCWLRLVERLKSGGPSLGRSPGAHKQRRPANQNQIQIFGEIGATQLLEQGSCLALFFTLFVSAIPVLAAPFLMPAPARDSHWLSVRLVPRRARSSRRRRKGR